MDDECRDHASGEASDDFDERRREDMEVTRFLLLEWRVDSGHLRILTSVACAGLAICIKRAYVIQGRSSSVRYRVRMRMRMRYTERDRARGWNGKRIESIGGSCFAETEQQPAAKKELTCLVAWDYAALRELVA